ncbi:MAG: PAS domain-containing protein [Dechloromonas sp.]|nr:PAS domain-containing protein [Dechloromonas sp.]
MVIVSPRFNPPELVPEVLDSLLQGSPVATFVIDGQHRVTHWNRACELVTGISAAEIIGSSDHWRGFYAAPRPILADYIVAGEIDQAMRNYEAGHCKASEVVVGAYEAEGFFPSLGERGCWLYFTAAPVLGPGGQVVGAIETLQNITARKLAEQALLDQNSALEDAIAERTRALEQSNAELRGLLQERCELQEQVGSASSTAFSAMSSMGEMGVLLQVLQRFNSCQRADELAQLVLDTLLSYELVGAVELRLPGQALRMFPDSGGLEAATFANLRDMGRIVGFHSRMIVNYPCLSILVSNMPRDDERAGRIRDNLAILAEAADARVRALDAELRRQQGEAAISGSLAGINKLLAAIEGRQKQSMAETRMAIHRLGETLEKRFVHLGLTEQQESYLLETVRDGLDGLIDAQDGQLDIQSELSAIIHRLADAV